MNIGGIKSAEPKLQRFYPIFYVKPQKMDELAQSVRAFLETEVQNKNTQEANTEQERDDT